MATGRRSRVGRPIYFSQERGSFSEISRTIPADRNSDGTPKKNTRWVNVPSVFAGGKIIENEDELYAIYKNNNFIDPITKKRLQFFDSESEAKNAAEKRSKTLMKKEI
jgi:hypothetical protein